jgi:hypothetical protein
LKIQELILALTKLAEETPESKDLRLFYIDRNNTFCDVENVKLICYPNSNSVRLDLGGHKTFVGNR